MMWAIFFICATNALIYYSLNHRLFNAGAIINLVWAAVLLINIFNPLDWYDLSNKTELYIVIGIISLDIGLFAIELFYSSIQKSEIKYAIMANKGPKVRLLFLYQVFLLIAMIPMIYKAITVLLNNKLNMFILRDLYATGGENGSYMSTLERLIYIHYIVNPGAMACIIIDSILCFKYGFWKKPFIFLMLLVLAITIISAARTSLFFSIIMLLVAYSDSKDNYSFSNLQGKNNLRRNIILYFIIIIIFVMVITIQRSSINSSLTSIMGRTLLSYFGGGIRIFDQTLRNPEQFGLDKYTFGVSSFSGLISILDVFNHYALSPFGINILPAGHSSTTVAQGFLYANVIIGPYTSMNAFPTMFYYFCRDGGVMIIVFMSCLFGILLEFLGKHRQLQPSIRNSFIYYLMLYAGIMSVCWWEPMRTEFWMVLIWGLLLYRMMIVKEEKAYTKAKKE